MQKKEVQNKARVNLSILGSKGLSKQDLTPETTKNNLLTIQRNIRNKKKKQFNMKMGKGY